MRTQTQQDLKSKREVSDIKLADINYMHRISRAKFLNVVLEKKTDTLWACFASCVAGLSLHKQYFDKNVTILPTPWIESNARFDRTYEIS